MVTNMTFRINNNDGDSSFAGSPGDYVAVDLVEDILYWTAGSVRLADGQAKDPTSTELDEAATLIDAGSDVQIAHCLLNDDSSGLLDEVEGMGANHQFVFCFDFDDATATEPQLEAWDDNTYGSASNHVLGNGTPANSMVKAIATTAGAPGGLPWGTAIAGAANVVGLNSGNPLGAAGQLYANIRLLVPTGYSTPFSETPVLTVRYTWS